MMRWGRTLLFVLCAAGLLDLVIEHARPASADGSNDRTTAFVQKQYELLGKGRFRELSGSVAEGVWRQEQRAFSVERLMTQAEFESRIEDDLGIGAWRVRIITLTAEGQQVIGRQEFSAQFPRESQLLDAIDPSNTVTEVYLVRMSGHNSGHCAILDWKRTIPVIRQRGKYLILMRGTPEVYALVHNEQWFSAVQF